MPDISINTPDAGFEFLQGLPDAIIQPVLELVLTRYKTAFSSELELVPIKEQFDSDFVDVPFVGVVWFRKIKWETIKYVEKKPRNCVAIVSNIGLDGMVVIKELEKELRLIGGKLRIFDSSGFGERRFKIYRKLCQTAYCERLLPEETNPLRKRRLKYQIKENARYMHRWQSGVSLLGIKVKGGSFLSALIQS